MPPRPEGKQYSYETRNRHAQPPQETVLRVLRKLAFPCMEKGPEQDEEHQEGRELRF